MSFRITAQRCIAVAAIAFISTSLARCVVAQDTENALKAYESGIQNETQFQTVFDFIRASDSEEKWRQIQWIPSLWTGIEIANEKQKPIFVWAMNGDPLGCV